MGVLGDPQGVVDAGPLGGGVLAGGLANQLGRDAGDLHLECDGAVRGNALGRIAR